MRKFLLFSALALVMGGLQGCVAENASQTTVESTSTPVGTNGEHVFQVQAPQSGAAPSFQSPGNANASKMISPLTQ